MTITWKISQLDRQTASGFVTTAHWTCLATQADQSTSIYSTCSWTETPEQQLVPYEDLTEETVLGWIWTSGVDKDATETAVISKLEQLISPTVQHGLPW